MARGYREGPVQAGDSITTSKHMLTPSPGHAARAARTLAAPPERGDDQVRNSAGTARRRRTARALAAGALLLGALATGLPAASAYPGAPWFEPDEPYSENFP